MVESGEYIREVNPWWRSMKNYARDRQLHFVKCTFGADASLVNGRVKNCLRKNLAKLGSFLTYHD